MAFFFLLLKNKFSTSSSHDCLGAWSKKNKENWPRLHIFSFSYPPPSHFLFIYLYTEVRAASHLGKSFLSQTYVANFGSNLATYTFCPIYTSGSPDPNGFWYAAFLPSSISSGHQWMTCTEENQISGGTRSRNKIWLYVCILIEKAFTLGSLHHLYS